MRCSAALILIQLAALTLGVSLAGAQPPLSKHVSLLKRIDVYDGINDCWGYRSPGGVELAIYGHQLGTSFVNATNPAAATEIANIPGPTSIWRDMFTYSHYCYIVTEGGTAGTGLQIVDLANPLAPVLVTTYTGNGFTTAHNLFIDVGAGIAYAVGAGPSGGMRILSLANPTSPVELDYFTPYYIHDIFVEGEVGYAGAINSGTLRIIDLSNPSNPVTIATHSYPNSFTHNAWPNAARTHCTTTDENGPGHLQVWDISDLGNIQLSSEYQVPGNIVHDVRLRDDVAYLSYYTAGARIVDLIDPTDPVELGYYDTSSLNGGFNGDWGVYPFRTGNVFYASDRQNGLYILEFTGSRAGWIEGTVSNASTTAPLSGATVTLVEDGAVASTDGSGFYRDGVQAATYTVLTKKFGFSTDTTVVAVPEGAAVDHDVALTPLQFGSMKVTVTASGSGVPVADLKATLLDSPLAPGTTNAAGEVVITGIPAGLPWTLRLAKFGRAPKDVTFLAPPNAQGTLAVTVSRGFFDDFNSDQAWIVGAPGDAATDGIWEREVPIGSFFNGPVGANNDASATGEGMAFITENHIAGAAAAISDVDGGRTTLRSPTFDATGVGTLTLEYSRWYSNRAPAQGSETFTCDVSTNGGASWTNLETIALGNDSWGAVSLPLSSIVIPSATMQLRFIVEDLDADTYIEGGVDEVRIVSSATDAPAFHRSSGAIQLAAPSPNPLRTSTAIAFETTRTGKTSVEIFDVTGRRVATVFAGDRVAAGTHRVTWDGKDTRGAEVVSGIYLVRLVTDEGTLSRKIAVMR